jgi:zinc protease
MTTRFFIFAALSLMCALVTGAVPGAQVPAASDLPNIEFEKHTLDNGLEVILSQDDSLPLVAVNLWYHVGPANEAEGRTGFAHLFEHMMFQGSKHVRADQHFLLLEAAGATGMNGTTDYDRTNYFETMPSNQLELALWLESDRMGYLLEQVDQAALSNQQDVVRNERRQNVENIPYRLANEALTQTLLPLGHPYYGRVIGSHADIQAAGLQDVRQFFREFYGPNNASLAIVGDIDPEETMKLVEQYFGSLRPGPGVPTLYVDTPAITEERRRVMPLRIELPRVYMGWLTAPIFEPGDADAVVAAEILGGGRSSRLYKALVYDQQIAQNVSVFQESLMLGSMFQLNVTARPGYTADDIERAINDLLDVFMRTPPTPEEVARSINSIETRIVRRLESLGGFGGVADRLNMYNRHLGDPGYLPEDVQRYRDVTSASVFAFVQDRLQPSRRAVVHAVPGEPEPLADVFTPEAPVQTSSTTFKGTNADEPWRFTQPEGGPLPALTLSLPESIQLDNGLTVIVSEERGVPVISAVLVIGSGSGANPIGQPGLASLVGSMLDEGTKSRTALQLADEVARLGATLGTSTNMDGTIITGRALTQNFGATLDLMADISLRPSFPTEELSRQKASRLAQLVQQRDNVGTRASDVFAEALYGSNHPYGLTQIGTEAAINVTTRDDLVSFWEKHLVPNNAALVVAGDISLVELRPLVERAFGSWTGESPQASSIGVPETSSAQVIIVDMPGAPQTQLRVGKVGVSRASEDYEALRVMNSGLGGMFSSRINMNLREEHGYTYGARSRFIFRKGPGPFEVSTGVRTNVTALAISEIFIELREAVSSPIEGEELLKVKDSLTLSLPGTFETSARVAGYYADVYLYDLGLDYYRDYGARIRAVTEEQVAEVADRYLVPEEMVVVAAGDRASIESELRDLNLGEVHVVE